MTMKENQNGTSFDSIGFGKETDPLTFGSKDRYELNDSRMDSNLTELEVKDTNDHSNFIVTDDSSMDNENGTMGSTKKAGQNGLSHHLSMDNESGTVGSPRKESEDGLSHQLSIWNKDTDSLSSDSSDIDKEQRSPEHESFDTVEEFADCNQSDSRDSSSPLFTDKKVLECDLPELEVCYKEIDYQILKDICIDEGRHQKDVNVIGSCMDEKPGYLFPQPPNDINHFEAEKDSSLESESFTADQCGSKEENDGKTLVSQERVDTCLENSLERDTFEHCERENAAESGEAYCDATGKAESGKTLVSQERVDTCLENSLERDTVEHCERGNAAEAGEAYCDATGKAESDSSEEDSLVDRKLPIEDFGTQSSLGTDGGNKVIVVPDQVLDQEAAPESRALSAEAGDTGNDVQADCLLYNSKVGNGSITFNFSAPEGLVVGNDIAEDVEEQCADMEDVHKDVNAENLPDAREARVHCTSNRVGDSRGQSLISNEDGKEQSADLGDLHKDVNAENLQDDREAKVQCTSNRVGDSHGQPLISNEDGKEQSAALGDVHKDVNAENLGDATEGKVHCTSNIGDSHRKSLISNEDGKEQYTDLGDEHKDVNGENLADITEGKVHCTSSIGDSHRKSLISNEGNSDGGSSSSYNQCAGSKGSSCENAHERSSDHKQANSDDIPTDDPAESPSNKSPGPTNDAQAPEPIAPNHDGKDTGDVPFFSHLQHDMGETSFSAASLITYSGPIAFSGSLSHRSDGSTTSGKSFAFPILQSEWNSSPVRMAKADRRHFRKHKGWRSGLLCCRF